MNYPNLNDDLFKRSALTYFTSGSNLVAENDNVFELIGLDKVQRYPLKGNPYLIDGVYIKSNHFKLWNTLFRYLPQGCFISNAYVSPDTQARIGLQLFEETYPTVSISSLIGNETNPELIGKYKEYYLFQIDYDLLRNKLSSSKVQWAKPNTSVHQRGLAIDITFNSEDYDIVIEILKWFYIHNNNIFNLSGIFIKQSDTELHVEFNEDSTNMGSQFGNTYMITGGINSPVADFLRNKDGRFYEILKRNGHRDLIESGLNRKSMARLPNSVKHQNSMLAKAIREILEDALSGQSGIISVLVQSQLEYLNGLINGILGSITVIGDELDTITSGRASILIRQAIESEISKTCDSNVIKNKLLKNSPITLEDSPVIKISDSPLSQANKTKAKKVRISTTKNNIATSRKETKNTPNNTDTNYDMMRTNSKDGVIVDIPYDHFSGMSTDFVVNLEKRSVARYITVVQSITRKDIVHGLQSKLVTAHAIDVNGNEVVFAQTKVDINTISIGFNIPFSGTIEVY